MRSLSGSQTNRCYKWDLDVYRHFCTKYPPGEALYDYQCSCWFDFQGPQGLYFIDFDVSNHLDGGNTFFQRVSIGGFA